MHEIKSFANGFEYVEVGNSVAHAKIAFQGAHIFEYNSDGKDLLWLSESSKFELGESIRGGIPICWPRFGNLDTSLPQHGFARVFLFDLINVDESSPNKTTLHFRLKESEKSREIWDYKFELEVIFIISDTLQVELKTTNTDAKAFMITQALHSYFKISNIANVHIKGLQNKPYFDALTGEYARQEDLISIDKEVDRIYQEVDKDIVLIDKDREIKIKVSGSKSAIIWNPWIQKCKRMSAMTADAYKKFVCIESANALDDFKMLGAKQKNSLTVTYTF